MHVAELLLDRIRPFSHSVPSLDRHGKIDLRPLQRNVRVGDVFALSKAYTRRNASRQ